MCTSCRETHPKTVSLNQKEEYEISGSRGSAHFVWRCSNCKKEHSASFIPIPPSKDTSPRPYTSQNGTFQPLIALDCRGLEFTQFHFTGKWHCLAADDDGNAKGAEFQFDLDEVDEDGRWDDYDEDAAREVGVRELKSRIERL
ncbi:hypothetical protein BCR39DRAFT_316264 [Naematelia encephala]|uniref:DUF866-domain-containing protein n=1 Tax=Naematelia encephala TaxID=71784 RepID=A0A1Y2AQD9_9TREE|nr:hypothetical protein BCR39DRAFT_316264 [Naematelia encephala]